MTSLPQPHPPLTLGERLLVQRRRHGLSQDEAAALAGTYRMQWSRWERDFPDQPVDPPPPGPIGRLSPLEICFVLRHRAGLSQSQLAAALGCSRQWVVDMEGGRAPIEQLTTYWSEYRARRPSRRS